MPRTRVVGNSVTARALALVAALAVVFASVPVTAGAHTMPPLTAMNVAKAAVAKIKRETHASSGRVLSCARKSKHRFVCKGEERYRTGASPCRFDITVRYTSTTTRATKYAISNYRCF
jgi:hypothetical protein